jgi:protein O-mannosyl-transferase
VLVSATVAVYAQTAGYGYVAYDDDQYVYQNAWVKSGLTATNVVWAFTSFFYSNWHPLTWISYMLDYSLFGLNPGAGHMVNLAFHLGSTLLLFFALYRATRQPWRCALVAGIFALHPLRVESVAWISERKDVLSTFFEMLTLLLYVNYAAKPDLRRYLLMAGAFALSLLSKPMGVTFPFLLLLVDYWPLGRLAWPIEPAAFRRLCLEKTPLIAMSVVTAVLTFLAQSGYGAVVSLNRLSVAARAANAAIAYVAYIAKSFWPVNLAVLYPARAPAPGTGVATALLLAAITAAVWLRVKQRPYLAVGWLWYLGTLVPVIGLIQVGIQAMADRYTYLPMVGISIMIVWSLAELAAGRSALRSVFFAGACAVLAIFSFIAYRQASYWNTSRTLFEHTLAVTKDNHIIQNNLGVVEAADGDPAAALALYHAALATAPDYADAHANLGHVLLRAGQFDEAQSSLQRAIALDPRLAQPHGDLGLLLAARGQFDEARAELEHALTLGPGDADNESNLCYVLTHLSRAGEAIAHCTTALRLDPNLANARLNLTNAQTALSQRTP